MAVGGGAAVVGTVVGVAARVGVSVDVGTEVSWTVRVGEGLGVLVAVEVPVSSCTVGVADGTPVGVAVLV